jgi:hypothetical protein
MTPVGNVNIATLDEPEKGMLAAKGISTGAPNQEFFSAFALRPGLAI